MEKIITSKEYEVHYYEIDYKKRLLITSLMNYFSDVAVLQGDQKGMDLKFMKENKIAWVLYKWDITIDRYPLLGEKITVSTMPYSFRKFYAYRKYEIKDSSGTVIGRADSIWFLIDIEKRRPMRIPQMMYDAYGITKEDNDALDIRKVIPVTEVQYEKSFNVRYSDIDTNKHVNNVKYASWAIETIPLDIVQNYTLKNIRIDYEKETTYGEMVKSQTQIIREEDKIICSHKVLDNEGKELNVAETIWI